MNVGKQDTSFTQQNHLESIYSPSRRFPLDSRGTVNSRDCLDFGLYEMFAIGCLFLAVNHEVGGESSG